MLAPAGRLECAPAGFPASSAYLDRSQSHAIASPSIGGRGRRPELGAQCRPKKKAAGAAFPFSLWMVLTRSTPKGEV